MEILDLATLITGVTSMGDVVILDNEKVSILEAEILKLPQVDLGTQHELSGKVYARTIYIRAGVVLTGAKHNHDHINIVFGDITVSTDEGMKRLTGYHVLPTKAGMKRVGFAHAGTYWTTCSYTELTEIEAIEDELTDESEMLQTRTLKLHGKETICHLD